MVGNLYPHGLQTSPKRKAVLDAKPALPVLFANIVHHVFGEVGGDNAVFAPGG